MQSFETHRYLAEQELSRIPGAAPELLAAQIATIAFCDSLEQLVVFPPSYAPVGFIAWLRSSHEHKQLFRDRDFAAVRQLTRDELTRGPVLFVAETWTQLPGAAAAAARILGQLRSVELICAYVQGGQPVRWRWRERRVKGGRYGVASR